MKNAPTKEPKKKPAGAKKDPAAEIKRLTEEVETLREQIATQDREIKNHRGVAAMHDEEVELLNGKLGQAMRVLRPLAEKTWDIKEEEWPAPQFAIYGKLTWGDVREAARVGGIIIQ